MSAEVIEVPANPDGVAGAPPPVEYRGAKSDKWDTVAVSVSAVVSTVVERMSYADVASFHTPITKSLSEANAETSASV